MDTESAITRYFSNYPPETVSCCKDGKGYVVYLFGSLDLQYSSDLQEFLLWMVENQEGKTRLVVDMNGVSYISSTGIGTLTNVMVKAKKRDLVLMLRNIQPKVRSVFELLGVMNFFELAESEGKDIEN